MRYPYLTFHPDISIYPVFPDLEGEPFILDLSSDSSLLVIPGTDDQRIFQEILDRKMEGHSWGLSSYLEDRSTLLKDCPQMVKEERFFHLGLDVIVPPGTPLCAPLPGTVYDAGYEEGSGNYGGYTVLKHDSEMYEPFFSLYGHLKKTSLPQKGAVIPAGRSFAETGEFDENGGWFYHTHLQILTLAGMERGMQFKGYCSRGMLTEIDSLCPSPLQLFTLPR